MKLSGLQVVNAVFGFCTPSDETWPDPLHHLGYQVTGIEREITTRVDGVPVSKVIDIACVSVSLDHFLCVEAKSRTVDPKQAQGYAAVKSRDFLDLYWDLPGMSESPSHDFTYFAGSEDVENTRIGLERSGISFPVVSCDGTRFDLYHGTFRSSELQVLFSEGVPLGANHEWPTKYVPFTSESPDSEMVARIAIAVARQILAGASFTATDICELSIPQWELCGIQEKATFKNKVRNIVSRAIREELEGYVERSQGTGGWATVDGSVTRTQQQQKLMRQAQAFVRRVELGYPYQAQQSLFDDQDADE